MSSSTNKLIKWFNGLPPSLRPREQDVLELKKICEKIDWSLSPIPVTFLTSFDVLKALDQVGANFEGGLFYNDNEGKQYDAFKKVAHLAKKSPSLWIWCSPQSSHDDYHDLIKKMNGPNFNKEDMEFSVYARGLIEILDYHSFEKFKQEHPEHVEIFYNNIAIIFAIDKYKSASANQRSTYFKWLVDIEKNNSGVIEVMLQRQGLPPTLFLKIKEQIIKEQVKITPKNFSPSQRF